MVTYASAKRARYSKLRAFKGADAEEMAYRSGMFLRATLLNDTKAAAWCDEHGIVIRAQAEGVNAAGGFLVPTEFEQAIVDLRDSAGTFRQEARQVVMTSDSMTIPRRVGGLQAAFVPESGMLPESTKQWDQVQMTAKKIGVMTRISSELAEDAVIDLADDLAQEMAYAFAQLEDSCGWNGDGSMQCGGVTGVARRIMRSADADRQVTAATGHDTFIEIDDRDLAAVMGALPKFAERNAKFYCSRGAWTYVFQRLIAAAGGNSIDTLTGPKVRRTYLGYPVVIDQTLPATPISMSGQAMLFFGDLSLACRMGNRRGITVKTSTDRFFEMDQIAIAATERMDIVTHDVSPLCVLIGG
jgi:HK97 family phage major capsid protein